jgi:hypothetical protein
MREGDNERREIMTAVINAAINNLNQQLEHSSCIEIRKARAKSSNHYHHRRQIILRHSGIAKISFSPFPNWQNVWCRQIKAAVNVERKIHFRGIIRSVFV